MHTECHFKHGEPSDELVAWVNGKVSHLERWPEFEHLECIFDKEGFSYSAKIHIRGHKVSFEANVLADDFHKAFDKAWNKISHQIDHWHGKKRDKNPHCHKINSIWKAG